MTNAHLFSGTELGRTFLRARGFDDVSGQRSGGIVDPQQVVLPPGTTLIRLFSRLDGAGGYGDWWNTPHELNRVLDHLDVSGTALLSRTAGGANALHGLLALLPWWNDADRFHVARVRNSLHAFHGEGDVAEGRRRQPNEVRVVPPKIIGSTGAQRGVRQLYVPAFRYCAQFDIVALGISVATDLRTLARSFDSGPLSFES